MLSCFCGALPETMIQMLPIELSSPRPAALGSFIGNLHNACEAGTGTACWTGLASVTKSVRPSRFYPGLERKTRLQNMVLCKVGVSGSL